MFSSGYCGDYAVALHEKTGYPIYVVRGYGPRDDYGQPYETAHAFVSSDNGKTGIDIVGSRPVKEIRKDVVFTMPIVKVRVERVSREELEDEMPCEPEALELARRLVG